jgi:hypothetical protein
VRQGIAGLDAEGRVFLGRGAIAVKLRGAIENAAADNDEADHQQGQQAIEDIDKAVSRRRRRAGWPCDHS